MNVSGGVQPKIKGVYEASQVDILERPLTGTLRPLSYGCVSWMYCLISRLVLSVSVRRW